MCLYTNSTKPKTAKCDIKVWKVLERKTVDGKDIYRSPFMGMEYQVGKGYKLESDLKSTQWRKAAYNVLPSHIPVRKVSEGFHAYTDKARAEFTANGMNMSPYRDEGYNVVVECIIPEGAKYFRDDMENTTVSSELKVVKII
jgi:hypothetical protein